MKIARFNLIVVVAVATMHAARASGPWFEEAPPTLPFYLHRLPAKTLQQIDSETRPQSSGARAVDYAAELQTVASRLTSESPSNLLPKVDELLELNRRNYGSSGTGWTAGGPAVANILHDVRDLLSATPAASAAEMTDYIRWRIDHAEGFGIGKEGEQHSRASPIVVSEVERRSENAPAALRAHWLYLRGALLLRSGDDTKSQQFFHRIVAEQPQHARAEAALFMEARCQLSRARDQQYTQRDPVLVEEQIPRAEQLFRSYLEKYPRGRFAGDALGWLGALAFDQRDLTGALKYYIQQTELADHPELRAPALEMCEKTLRRIASDPQDTALNEVARHPREATALVYLIVNSTESDDSNGEYDAVETVKEWKKSILPRLARAVAAEKARYEQQTWQPRYLATLAHAASSAGKQPEALQLIGLAGAGAEKSDDLLFARAVALQRSGRLPDAMRDFRAMISAFPKSALAPGAHLRLAVALQDSHQAGEAVVELNRLLPTSAPEGTTGVDEEPEFVDDTARPAEPSNAEPAQIKQLIDTLLNFAPLPELAAPLQNSAVDELLRLRLTRSIAQRYLAREDFENARKFMSPVEWSLQAERLEKLTREAAQASAPAARAQKLIELGDAWAAARKQLLNAPLDAQETRADVFAGEHSRAGVLRRENAKALVPAAAAEEELDSREELRHAMQHWLKAAEAQPNSQAAAAAIWRALRVIPKIADVSEYTLARAHETNAGAFSKTLYERLRRECADSREARELAVYWNFSLLPKDDETGGLRDYFGGSIHDGMFASELVAALQIGADEEEDERRGDWEPVLSEIRSLGKTAASMNATAFTTSARRLRGDVQKRFSDVSESPLVNFADDLVLFAQRPNVSAAARGRYVQLRIDVLRESAIHASWSLSEGGRNYDEERQQPDADAILRERIGSALKDPAMRPVIDFLEFLDAAVVANDIIDVPIEGLDKDGEPFTYRSRDYKLLEEMTARFLAKHPQSPKREAATLLHARAVFMLSRPEFYKNWEEWPTSDRWEGSVPLLFHQREPFAPERVLAALNGYLRPYGQGRYFPDVRSYRADVAVRMRDWERALDLTIAQAADSAHPELHPEAARRFANIFTQLADEENRAALLAAIRKRPQAKSALEGFVQIHRHDHPLLYLKQYLADQLGLEFQASGDN